MMQAAESIGPMTPELLAALEARGFDAEAFLKLDLGVGESRQQPGALAIPFYDGQNVVGVKVRAIEQGLRRIRPGQAVRCRRDLLQPQLPQRPRAGERAADRCRG